MEINIAWVHVDCSFPSNFRLFRQFRLFRRSGFSILPYFMAYSKLHVPCFQVAITTKGGVKKYVVWTPSRSTAIKRVTWKNYASIAAAVVNSPSTSKSAISNVALKIKREMKTLGSVSHDSVLRDMVEAIKWYSWESFTRTFPEVTNSNGITIQDCTQTDCKRATAM